MSELLPGAERFAWLTKREAAARARVSERTVQRAIASGKLQASGGREPGVVVRIRVEWLDDWLERRL